LAGPPDPGAEDPETAVVGGGEAGPGRGSSALVLDPGLVARVEALCDLLERAEGWVAELDADACFWQVWRSAPAFSELILRAEVDPTDADTQRQLDALTAFSRALSLFVDGRPGASMRTYLHVVERAAAPRPGSPPPPSLFVGGGRGPGMRPSLDVVERAVFASDLWLPPAMTRTD